MVHTFLFRLKPSRRCIHFLLFQKTVLLINFIIEVQNNKNSAEICGTVSRYLSQTFSTKNKNWIILKLTFSPSNMNQSTICCTARAFDILRLDSGVPLCLLFKHKKVCSDQREIGNYWGLLVARIVASIVVAITYMFEVGCSVEVSNVDARSGR